MNHLYINPNLQIHEFFNRLFVLQHPNYGSFLENKEARWPSFISCEGNNVRIGVKFLLHEQWKETKEVVALLYELSKSERLCGKIGSVNGVILILVGMARSNSKNVLIVEKADKTLDNLAQCENNVQQMAEYDRLQPLLNLLLEGSVETKLSMASLLSELVLNNDVKVFMVRIVDFSLINPMNNSDMQSKEATLKALNQISLDDSSAMVLIEADILSPLIKGLFTVGEKQLPMRLKEVSATILAKVVNSGYDFNLIEVGPDHQTLISEEIIHNLLHLISNTGPAIGCKLLQVLVGLIYSSSTVYNVLSYIKSSSALNSNPNISL